MTYPLRKEHKSAESYLYALECWMSETRKEEARIMGLFKKEKWTKDRPSWLDDGGNIFHIELLPGKLKTAIELLSGAICARNLKSNMLGKTIENGQKIIFVRGN